MALRRSGVPCDLIVSDHMMARMTGLMMLERLRDEGDTTPVLLVSGHIAPDVYLAALARPQVAVLNKPYTRTAMEQAIRELMDASGCHDDT